MKPRLPPSRFQNYRLPTGRTVPKPPNLPDVVTNLSLLSLLESEGLKRVIVCWDAL